MKFNTLEGLNNEQIEAVKSTEGYIRIIAGAGSGKTKALTHRYIYLVEELGISTANILCVTFTNKAATEMKKRIRNMIGDKDTGLVCTFHGFCRQLLREDIHTINYPDKFVIMDNEDSSSLLKIVFEELDIKHRQCTIEKAKDIISRTKSLGTYVEDILNTDTLDLKNKCKQSEAIDDKIFYGYLYQQKKRFLLDFDDLIFFTLYILNQYPKVANKWQKRMQYIMVDEFQDVNSSHYALASILSEYHKNLFIVGDPDQTIYSWRGAKVNFILDFDKVYTNSKTLFMNSNYRSSDKIIDVSNSIIDKNRIRIKKQLTPTIKSDTQVIYNHALSEEEEGKWIGSQIKLILSNNYNYSDVAILYRAHYVSRSIEESLIKEKIPYVIYSGVPFYERKEIKDILSYMRMIISEDDLSFIRIINEPKRNFGKSRMKIIHDFAEQNNCTLYDALQINIDNNLIRKSKANSFVKLIEKYKKVYHEMSISDLLTALLSESGYEEMLRLGGEEERLDNLSEFKNSISEYELLAGEETSLAGYLQDIALYTNSDVKNSKEKIKLMTIHSAKGLEFSFVFVCGLNEGILPSARVNTKEDLEEERRLAYVAYTRAEKALFLSEAEGYLRNGSFRLPSRFIFDIDKKFLKYNVELQDELLNNSKEFITNSEINLYEEVSKAKFNKGDKIAHDILGYGVINDIDDTKYSYVIKFDKSETERSISFDAKLFLIKENQDEIKNIQKVLENKNNKISLFTEKGNDKDRDNEEILVDVYKDNVDEEKSILKISQEKNIQEEKERLKVQYSKDISQEVKRITAEHDNIIKEKIKLLEAEQNELLNKEKDSLKLEYEKLIRGEKERLKVQYSKDISQEVKRITAEHDTVMKEKIKALEVEQKRFVNKEQENLKLEYEKSIRNERERLKVQCSKDLSKEVKRITNEYDTSMKEKIKLLEAKQEKLLNKEKEIIKLGYEKLIKEEKKLLNIERNKLKEEEKNIIENQKMQLKSEYNELIDKYRNKLGMIIKDKIEELTKIVEYNKHCILGSRATKRKEAIIQINILKDMLKNILIKS